MKRTADQVRRRYAEMCRLVVRWRLSGLSAVAFGQAYRCSPHRLRRWRRELRGTSPGPRPRVLSWHGGMVDIEVHDQYFLTALRVFRRQIADCHPDRRRWTKLGRREERIVPVRFLTQPHATGAFRQARKNLDRWLQRETAWYATFGLLPPERCATRVGSPRRRGLVLDAAASVPVLDVKGCVS